MLNSPEQKKISTFFEVLPALHILLAGLKNCRHRYNFFFFKILLINFCHGRNNPFYVHLDKEVKVNLYTKKHTKKLGS